MKKELLTDGRAVEDRQALALHECASVLMRKFRIEPGLLAGSVYRCNGMPSSAITKGCAKYHPRRRRAAAKPRFDQDGVGVRRWEVRCGLPTIRELAATSGTVPANPPSRYTS
jgi:hypothetical protein